MQDRPTFPTTLRGKFNRPPSDLVASFLESNCWQHCTFSTLQLKSLAVRVEPPLVVMVLLRLAIRNGSGVASVAEGRMRKIAAKATKRVMTERNMVDDAPCVWVVKDEF